MLYGTRGKIQSFDMLELVKLRFKPSVIQPSGAAKRLVHRAMAIR
jgi:hypothetical protein